MLLTASIWISCSSPEVGSITLPAGRSSRAIMQPGADDPPKPTAQTKRGGKTQESRSGGSIRDRALKKG
jgi:hypothetical protein